MKFIKKERQTYHHGNLREALITEAAHIIMETGLGKLSLRKLAAQCNVSSMALYRHFPNKDALVVAVLQRGYQLLEQQLYVIYHQCEEGVIETLKALGKGYVDFAQKNKNFFCLMYGGNLFPFNKNERIERQADVIFQFLKSILKKGMNENLIVERDLNEISFAAWSYLHGITSLVLQGKVENINCEVDVLLNRMMDYLYFGFKPAG